jgi:hypothetical protein
MMYLEFMARKFTGLIRHLDLISLDRKVMQIGRASASIMISSIQIEWVRS